MHARQLIRGGLMALVLTLGCVSANTHSAELRSENGETKMKTKIAVVSSSDALEQFTGGEDGKQGLTVVDPTALLNQAPALKLDDIVEDPKDPFIATRSGKRRPMLVENSDDWADEAPVAKMPRQILSRVKRCGGDDDDGGANRSRRARRRARRTRARRTRAERRAANKAASTTTTTVTRKVIQNGQVVSETREGGPVVAASGQPVSSTVVHQPASAPAPALGAQPVVIQQPAVAAAAAAVPSISVQGSIKVN